MQFLMPPNIHPEKKPGERCLMSSERIRCYFSNLKATVTTRVQNFGFASKFLTPSFVQRSLDSSDFSRFVSGVFLQKFLLKSRYRKSCKHWKCSDATKWVHRRGSSESKFTEIPASHGMVVRWSSGAAQNALTNTDRKGWSDEELNEDDLIV